MRKKPSNTLNIIKNSEIKHGRIISGQKELLNLFDDLSNIISASKTLKPESQEDKKKEQENVKLKQENENENGNQNENENENDNNNENDNDNENRNENENEDEDDYYDYEKQNKTIDHNKIIKGKNDILDEIIDKSKSFKEEIESLKKQKV